MNDEGHVVADVAGFLMRPDPNEKASKGGIVGDADRLVPFSERTAGLLKEIFQARRCVSRQV